MAAVLIGINAVSANLVDLRLADLLTKLYFNAERSSEDVLSRYRPSVIQVGLLLQLGLAVVLFVAAALLDVVFIPYLTAAPVGAATIVAAAGAQAVSYAVALLTYVQRFGQRFVLLGVAQLVSAIAGAAAMIYSVWLNADVAGFADGLLLAAVVSAGVMTYATARTFRALHPITVARVDRSLAFRDYVQNWRFLFSTNLLGYTKLLHRAADVLLVGYLADDRQTGLYKLARSLTDALYTAFDAASKVYQPSLFAMLRENRFREYRHTAGRIVLGSAVLSALLLIGEMAFLPRLIDVLFGPAFAEALPAIIVLTLPFFFVCGLFLWIWPALVFHGDIGKYTLFSFVSILVAQYAFGIGFYLYKTSITWFAIGYALSYVMLYGMAMHHMRKRYAELMPNLGAA